MELYVNNEKLDVTLENEKTVGDVLKSFQQTCEQYNMATVAIKLDGKQIAAEIFDSTAALLITDTTKIELTVISQKAVEESFNSLHKIFLDLAEQLEQVPVELQSGKDSIAHKTIADLADALDKFCHTTTLLALFPQMYNGFKIKGKPLADFFSDLSGVLGDFKKALESKDTVSIGDLAEYEIRPRLQDIAESIDEVSHGNCYE